MSLPHIGHVLSVNVHVDCRATLQQMPGFASVLCLERVLLWCTDMFLYYSPGNIMNINHLYLLSLISLLGIFVVHSLLRTSAGIEPRC